MRFSFSFELFLCVCAYLDAIYVVFYAMSISMSDHFNLWDGVIINYFSKKEMKYLGKSVNLRSKSENQADR